MKKRGEEAEPRNRAKKRSEETQGRSGVNKRSDEAQRGKCNCIIFEALEESVTESFLKLRRKVQLNVLKVG